MLAESHPDSQLIYPVLPRPLDSSIVEHGCDARLSGRTALGFLENEVGWTYKSQLLIGSADSIAWLFFPHL